MGCDIHVHTEVKIKGTWHHVGHPNVGRDYNLFAKMADVRNGEPRIEPLAQPRGIPADATFFTMFDYEHDAGHSASWISGEEIEILDDWMRERDKFQRGFICIERKFGYLFGNSWNVKKYPEDVPEGVEDARWIFWFDN